MKTIDFFPQNKGKIICFNMKLMNMVTWHGGIAKPQSHNPSCTPHNKSGKKSINLGEDNKTRPEVNDSISSSEWK